MARALVAFCCVGVLCSLSPYASAQEQNPPFRKLVDLTHPFDKATIYWPTEPGFRLENTALGVTEKGYFYAANRFATAEHGGTHIDAPIHFFAERQTVDQIPLWRLMGQAVCVDISATCAVDRDYRVSVEDLQAWEAQTGESLTDKIVLLRTGFARYWPDRQQYLGTAETGRGAVPLLRFPGLDPTAAKWLVSRRKIRAVGIDTASIDYGQSSDFQAHVTLCQANVPIFENVANLQQLPPHGFTVTALPMKIAGGSGAPCRIIATLDE